MCLGKKSSHGSKQSPRSLSHLQTLFLDADHHLVLLTLDTQAQVQGRMLLLCISHRPLSHGGQPWQAGQAWFLWRPRGKGKGQADPRRWRIAASWIMVTQDVKFRREHRLQRIDQI